MQPFSPKVSAFSSVPMNSAEGFTINSFVFLDLETSHLDRCERPTIIEMSLFAVHRTGLLHPDVLTSINRARREDATYDLSKVLSPRVVDKLTLCMDPRKHTSAETFCLTKLDNLNLGESKKMSLDMDVISMLNIFLSRQEAPICLVAHNGNKFDFPILRTEMSRVTAEEPFKDLYCVDSLEGFRDNFTESETKQDAGPLSMKRKLPDNSRGLVCPEKRGTSLSETTTSADEIGVVPPGDIYVPALSGSDKASTNFPMVCGSSSHASSSSSIMPQISEDLGASALPSKTPLDPVSLDNISTERIPYNSSDNTPERNSTKRPSPPPPPKKVNHHYHTEAKSKKISYSLINIFKRTFGQEPPVSHSAEDDVMSLIKILLPRVEEFVNWADIHATQYKDVGLYYKPLKPRRKLFDD